MTRVDVTGRRDFAFSEWHRSLEGNLPAIDIDFCEYCAHCRKPLALFEVAIDEGKTSEFKTTTVIRNLARMAGVPAYCVLYTLRRHIHYGYEYIESFRVQRVAPGRTHWKTITPEGMERFVRKIHRDGCDCNSALFARAMGKETAV